MIGRALSALANAGEACFAVVAKLLRRRPQRLQLPALRKL